VIVARLEGGQCVSRYHVVTNPTVKRVSCILLTSNEDASNTQYLDEGRALEMSFTPKEVASYTRFLEKGSSRAQELFSSHEGTLPDFSNLMDFRKALMTVREEYKAYGKVDWLMGVYDNPDKDDPWFPFISKKRLFHPITFDSKPGPPASPTDGIIWDPEDLEAWKLAEKEKLDAGPWIPNDISDLEAAEYKLWLELADPTPEPASLEPIKGPTKREGSLQ
jgi:hypothetical protein